tara:strand:+ start:2531 stop:2977 length:447 start_codon:yes stop_codon:yes gene_type:complete
MSKHLFAIALVISLTFACSGEETSDPLAFCEKFITVAAPDSPLNNFDFNNAESVEKAIMDLKVLSTDPPAAIAQNTNEVVDLYKSILEALVASAPDDRPMILLEFQNEINESISSIESLENYGETVCGIDFDEESPATTSEIPLDLNN